MYSGWSPKKSISASISFPKLFVLSLLVLSNITLLLFGSTLSRLVAWVKLVDQVNASSSANHLTSPGTFLQTSDGINYLHVKLGRDHAVASGGSESSNSADKDCEDCEDKSLHGEIIYPFVRLFVKYGFQLMVIMTDIEE